MYNCLFSCYKKPENIKEPNIDNIYQNISKNEKTEFINNIELLFELNKEVNSKNKGVLYLYTLKYNILRITGGVAGLAYV